MKSDFVLKKRLPGVENAGMVQKVYCPAKRRNMWNEAPGAVLVPWSRKHPRTPKEL